MARLVRVTQDNVALLDGVYDTGDEVTVPDVTYQNLLDDNAFASGLLEDLGPVSEPGGDVVVGTGPGTVAAGDDSRIVGALQKTANLSDVSDPVEARDNLGLADAVGGELTTDPTLVFENALL